MTGDMVGEALRKQYDKFLHKKVPTEDIINMADFVLKNNFFEFNSKFSQQIFGTAVCYYELH